jgi:hypothetical protein
MTLGEYIAEVREHRLVGGRHPWYVFRGHPVPAMSEGPNSLVPYEYCPTPPAFIEAFSKMEMPKERRSAIGIKSREFFVNAQWALGGEGTGAPVRFSIVFFDCANRMEE